MISRQSLLLVLNVILSSSSCRAGPLAARQDSGDFQIRQFMDASIMKFLESQNVDSKYYVPVPGSIIIDWITTDGIPDQAKANAGILQAADTLRSNNDSQPVMFFSDNYINFLKEAEKLNPVDNSTDAQLNATAQAADAACLEDMKNVTMKAVKDYTDFGGQINGTAFTDQAFLQWAQESEDEYNVAVTKCQDARNKVLEDYDTLKGDNYALFSRAYENIRPFTLEMTAVTPGISMSVDPQDFTGTTQVPSPGGGNFYPLYDMDDLTGIMQSWLGSDIDVDGNPQYSFDSSVDHTSDITKSDSGSGSFSFIWEAWSGDADASHSDEEHILNSTATSFSVKYGGFQLVNINYGAWFDDFRAASAVQSGADNQTQNMKPALDQFFGTDAEHPGSAAVYNRMALVGYKPELTMSVTDQDTYDQIKDTQAGANVCFLLFCLGGSGSDHQETVTTDDSTKSVSFKDDSAHVVGFVQGNFWDSSSV